ncbi:glycosyltransferase family 4 protein [Ohtaekwangia sp.]|uniref:glycosyltransferase family 4 protein n=2 Tax=Ohtaekwangia sp. TaxID=2066019 RepID=UPI002FDDCC45
MRVLMFGWEFPPHISGGLGTACFGLTKSLIKEGVDILFVVPKLYGNENVAKVHFIDAGMVPVPANRRRITVTQRIEEPGEILQGEHMHITTLEVESFLSPYRTARSTTPLVAMESWNYQLDPTVSFVEEEIEIVDTFTHRFSGTYGPNLILETQQLAEVAAALATQYEFDVIHAHDWMTFPAGIAAQEASGKPLIAHVHSTEYDRSGESVDPVVYEIERKGIAAADRIIAVSNWTKKILVSRYQADADKVEVTHNGITPRERYKALASYEPFDNAKIVTFLGRLTFQKGPFYFIEAARKVLEKFPDVHFVVAGSGDLFPQVVERVAQLRLSSRFHFTGFLRGESVDKVWSISNLYVMPSVSEPFGITPLEAIQAGVPVIMSNQSGVAEVMPHAIKVDFWNIDALADAICNVLAYESLSDTLKKNSFNEIKNMTWEKAAKKIKTIYYELN